MGVRATGPVSKLHPKLIRFCSTCVKVLFQVANTNYTPGMTKGNRSPTERPKQQREKERFVSSLEVSNVFQYNALQTIIQLQSLILYIQTSWFTQTVLLISLKSNKTKTMRSYWWCGSFLNEGGGGSDFGKPVSWSGRQWTLWLLKSSSCIRHISNIYNSANFPDQSSLHKLNPWCETAKSNWADVDKKADMPAC